MWLDNVLIWCPLNIPYAAVGRGCWGTSHDAPSTSPLLSSLLLCMHLNIMSLIFYALPCSLWYVLSVLVSLPLLFQVSLALKPPSCSCRWLLAPPTCQEFMISFFICGISILSPLFTCLSLYALYTSLFLSSLSPRAHGGIVRLLCFYL